MLDDPIGDGRIEIAVAHSVLPLMARRCRSADRLTAALPSRSITVSHNPPYTPSYSNGATAWMIRRCSRQRDVIGVGVHEADVLAVSDNLDDVAGQQRPLAACAALPVQHRAAIEVTATANECQP